MEYRLHKVKCGVWEQSINGKDGEWKGEHVEQSMRHEEKRGCAPVPDCKMTFGTGAQNME